MSIIPLIMFHWENISWAVESRRKKDYILKRVDLARGTILFNSVSFPHTHSATEKKNRLFSFFLAEFIFLCVGVRFIYSTRTAPCEYHERKLITIAIVCEMLFSTLLHIIRSVKRQLFFEWKNQTNMSIFCVVSEIVFGRQYIPIVFISYLYFAATSPSPVCWSSSFVQK